MGRPKNTAARRGQIVQATIEVMAERGYAGASIQAIAAAAGLAPGLLHYHFRSKQEVLLAVVDELEARVTRRFEAVGARSARERLDAFIDVHLALDDGADPRAVACWVVVGAEALRQPEIRTAYEAAVRRALDRLRGLIDAARGPRTALESEEIAAGLFAAIEGCYRLAVAARAAPPGFAARTVRRMAAGLLGEAPA